MRRWIFVACFAAAVAGCGPRETTEESRAEDAARIQRAAAAAQAELDADHQRFSGIATSLAPDTRERVPRNLPSEEAPKSESSSKTQDRPNAASIPTPAPSPQLPVVGKAVDFGNEPSIQLIRAVAVLDNLQVDGLDCYSTLKVYATPSQSQLNKCLAFMERMVKGAEFTQALEILSALAKQDQLVKEHYASFAKAKRLSEQLSEYNEFAWARMRTLTSR